MASADDANSKTTLLRIPMRFLPLRYIAAFAARLGLVASAKPEILSGQMNEKLRAIKVQPFPVPPLIFKRRITAKTVRLQWEEAHRNPDGERSAADLLEYIRSPAAKAAVERRGFAALE